MTTQLTTKKVRLSYANVWEPKAMQEGQEPKYSVCLLIPKSDKETVKRIREAIEEEKEAGKGIWNNKIPANLKLPLRDGDEERPEDENYAGHWFINCNSKTRPGIVDKKVQPILDQDEVYSGCYARVAVSFYPFNSNGNKGIACGLNHIQKIADGDRLSGGISVDAAFSDSFDDEDDLLG